MHDDSLITVAWENWLRLTVVPVWDVISSQVPWQTQAQQGPSPLASSQAQTLGNNIHNAPDTSSI